MKKERLLCSETKELGSDALRERPRHVPCPQQQDLQPAPWIRKGFAISFAVGGSYAGHTPKREDL